ncbi:MAG: MOSC domain-containing protein [Syntrophomonadaceae bacterium]|nr:MOSC domain-containing protein [Syntrophomonadaceae bacterium]
MGCIVGVCVGEKRGVGKKNVKEGYLKKDYGLPGDAHAGMEKQVSVLAMETIEEAASAKGITALPGDFAENITLRGVDLKGVKRGQRLRLGEAEVEVVQVGKEPDPSHSFSFHGMALLVTEGCFCRVTRSGPVKVGDLAEIIEE